MADYKQKHYFGSTQSIMSSASTVAAGNFSAAAATTFDNTTDAVAAYAPYANILVEAYFTTAPTAGRTIEVWALAQGVDGTNNETDAPSGTASGGAHLLGVMVLANTANALQRREIQGVSIAGLRKANIYIKNGADQTIQAGSGNTVVKITPYTLGFVG